MPINRQELLDAVEEIIAREQSTVLSLGYDGGAPGTAGVLWVDRWRGLFFVRSSDIVEEGPFDSLAEALLECEAFSVVTANPELSSRVLKMEQLKDVGLGLVGEGD